MTTTTDTFALADAHNNQGNILYARREYDEAIAHYQEVLRLQPNSAEAHYNLGNVFKKLHRLDDAIDCYRRALQLNPTLAEAHNNLGIVYKQLDRLDEAVSCYRQALRFKPNHADAWTNVGNVHGERGQFEDALACYDRALRIDPDHAYTHFNRAGQWLLKGEWAAGWREYEWRWQTTDFPHYDFPQPRWDGSPLAGRRLLVLAEQGLGDTLHFVRYIALLRQGGDKVIFQCQPALKRLLAESLGADQLIDQGESLPSFDVYIPLLSLPMVLGTSPATVPVVFPYLKTNPEQGDHWRRELEPIRGFKVGIAWQGSPTYLGDRQRSIPLLQFAPLAEVPGVHLISLQKGHGTEQLQALAGQFPVLDVGSRFDDFTDTAGVIKGLDLVICCDTAVAHLAGALGTAVWIALPFMPDWRWLLHREDSPWYPSVRLFRQKERGQWDDVFERLAAELRARILQR